ncbi:hypothetical protein XENORESO_005474, partial [Xenotaenia resolanae]
WMQRRAFLCGSLVSFGSETTRNLRTPLPELRSLICIRSSSRFRIKGRKLTRRTTT